MSFVYACALVLVDAKRREPFVSSENPPCAASVSLPACSNVATSWSLHHFIIMALDGFASPVRSAHSFITVLISNTTT
ncbi:hypothetical protein EJ03DRAFT_193880 [Teratosphaeria nubilosa]|uniref:Uncharacterized protein n=1 Tax=Teratosphaeria nubilosa TaxID=161662 RepID=A0A6G1KZ42_9PEZI|nr:hypothetical protein EJ03DRAFT_193880 [Teratosphaeria nubilosa]